MSRAFVKESDEGADAAPLPERQIPAHPNYVTARGLAQLQTRVRDLAAACETLKPAVADDAGAKDKLRTLERDLRYYRAQLERAELVAASPQHDTVHFGAQVTVRNEVGVQQRLRIVGDDEADAAAGDISWASPLARALIGARVGDCVAWRPPANSAANSARESEIEILALTYA